jgi:hypothetical protein
VWDFEFESDFGTAAESESNTDGAAEGEFVGPGVDGVSARDKAADAEGSVA